VSTHLEEALMTDARSRPCHLGRARRAALVLVAAFAVAGAGCSAERRLVEGEIESRTDSAFYELPDPVPAGDAGTLVRSERLLGAPDGSEAWRVLYRSTDESGAAMVVSGVVVAPTGEAPQGGRTVVSWAHPTTGAATRCAPSLGVDPFILMEGVHELLAAGHVIAATDYPAMGVEGPPSYLIGVTEGHSVLDAARAARAIPETGSGDEVVLWGHSQGGHAALFAGQEAVSYAPDLQVLGVAVAAPATELGALLDDDIGDVSGVTIGAYAFDAYQRAYGSGDEQEGLETVLTEAGAAAVPQMAALCLLGQNKELHEIAGPLVGGFLAHDPATTQPWAGWLQANTPGATPIGVPILVGQGQSDTLVHPDVTADYVSKICAAGEHVLFERYDHIGHGLVAEVTVPRLIGWISDLQAGRTPEQNCSAS
jgi:acetyl esterase/lipase